MPALIVAPRAEAQIIDVLAHTFEQFGASKHAEYRALIRDALNTLAQRPETGKARPDIHPEARTLHIARSGHRARHLFLYRIRTAVEIAAFLHDAMDLQRQRPREWK